MAIITDLYVFLIILFRWENIGIKIKKSFIKPYFIIVKIDISSIVPLLPLQLLNSSAIRLHFLSYVYEYQYELSKNSSKATFVLLSIPFVWKLVLSHHRVCLCTSFTCFIISKRILCATALLIRDNFYRLFWTI